MIIFFSGTAVCIFLALLLIRDFLRDPIGWIVKGAVGLFLIFFVCNWLAHPDYKIDQVVIASLSDIKNANWSWK